MTRVQFSLTGLIVAVFIFAAACAAMTSNLVLVASAVLTVQYALLALGIVGIVARRGADRLFWVGFVVFGYVYSSAVHQGMGEEWFWNRARYWPSEDTLITDRVLLLAFNQRKIAPKVGAIVDGEWSPGGFYPAKVTQIGDDGSVLLAWLDGSVPKWVKPSAIHGNWQSFRATGHSVFAILVSLIGGYLAMLLFATPSHNDRPLAGKETEHAKPSCGTP